MQSVSLPTRSHPNRAMRAAPAAPRRIALATLVAGAALGLAACDSTVLPQPVCDFGPVKRQAGAPISGPVLVAQTPGSMTDMPLNAVNITDIAITNKVLVQATNAQRTQTGDVQVWARLVNCTDYPLQIEGRTHFLAESQAPAEKPTAWSRVYLPPKTINNYTALSTRGPSVATYMIEIREGS